MSPNAGADHEPDDAPSVDRQMRRIATELLTDLDASPVGPQPQAADRANGGNALLPPDKQRLLDEHVARAMRRCLSNLAETGLVGRDNEIPSRHFWQVAGDRLQVGELQWHARRKPLGYAGDYRMLEKIIRHHRAPSAWGSAFDRFFQYQAAPQAVRNRTAYVTDRIVDTAREAREPAVVVSVGCGPALDVSAAIDQLIYDGVPLPELRLLDMDPYALEYVQSQLGPKLPPHQLRVQRVNLVKLPERYAAQQLLSGAHLIVCTGLFDYLDDATAARMLALFWRHLHAGGTMIVFGFSPLNTSRTYMEWIGNWYLVHRDVAQMWSLLDQAEIPAEQSGVDAEPQGVNLFITAIQ